MNPAHTWNPAEYDRFKADRSQPFHDLVARIPQIPAQTVVDMGCGTGVLTATLLARWPSAMITGVDSSEPMLAEARRLAEPQRLNFVHASMEEWQPNQPVDVLISNAALQWAANDLATLRHWAGLLAPRASLAVQMPNNGSSVAYKIHSAMVREPEWEAKLHGLRPNSEDRKPIGEYASALLDLGFEVSAWETVYQQRMATAADIVVWMRSTVMGPTLKALDGGDQSAFINEMIARVTAAYEHGPHGVWFAFRRMFFVAWR